MSRADEEEPTERPGPPGSERETELARALRSLRAPSDTSDRAPTQTGSGLRGVAFESDGPTLANEMPGSTVRTARLGPAEEEPTLTPVHALASPLQDEGREPPAPESAIERLKSDRERLTETRERFGPFLLLGRLGRGGLGEVRLAVHNRPGEEPIYCAVKRIPSLSRAPTFQVDEALSMFLDEAKVSRRFDHPNVIRALAHGHHAGRPYLAMEVLDGVTLRQLLEIAVEPLPLWAALDVACQATAGLGYVHSLRGDSGEPLQLVHRDVSPNNLMVTRSGRVKLVDFGLARFLGRNHVTEVGIIKGTLRYMSPEQLAGGEFDQRSDVFSLGMTLAELFGDREVLESGFMNPRSFEYCVEEACRVAGQVPEVIGKLLATMTTYDPSKRWITMHDAAKLLASVRQGPLGVAIEAFAHAHVFRHIRPLGSLIAWSAEGHG